MCSRREKFQTGHGSFIARDQDQGKNGNFEKYYLTCILIVGFANLVPRSQREIWVREVRDLQEISSVWIRIKMAHVSGKWELSMAKFRVTSVSSRQFSSTKTLMIIYCHPFSVVISQ